MRERKIELKFDQQKLVLILLIFLVIGFSVVKPEFINARSLDNIIRTFSMYGIVTAVFVTNYEMTMGAMIGVNELGIQIPEQLSMIGFDNLQFARACRPKLTIVSQPTDRIAKEIARIILEHLEKKEERSEEPFMEKLQTEIMEGKSVSILNR